TAGEYRQQLAAAGLADVRIEPAHAACPGVTAAVVRASNPAPADQAGGPAAAGQAGGPAAAGQVPEAAAVSAGGPAAGQVPAAAVVRAGGAAAADRAGGAAVVVRTMRDGDWPAVVAIYAEGIATGDATFETEPPTWAQWDTTHLAEHRLVAVDGDRVLGWTAVGRVSDRCAYAGVVENSIYVAASAQRRGVGRALLDALIASTEAAGIWTIQTGVFPENEPSLALHRAAGFRVVGVRERPGRLRGRWRDVVLLERRSAVSGS
ncbi:MAG TPA: GNAT family N-acetyltransferase, partial [Mycobacteriales bacterium]